MTFTTLNLTNERVLVKGTDSEKTKGQTVLDGTEWNEVKRHNSYTDAKGDFETEVEEFFKPLTDAASKLDTAWQAPAVDPMTYVVLHEGTDHVEGAEQAIIKLSHDSVVLRLIELGDTDRLVWVDDKLEILQVLDTPTS